MREVAIVGAAMAPFGELEHLAFKDLVGDVVAEVVASTDEPLRRDDIGAAWMAELGTTDGFPAGILADAGGLDGIPITRVENACATGSAAIQQAVLALGAGYCDVALVFGGEKLREGTSADTFWEWMGQMRDRAWDYPLALIAPANFALHVQRYLHEYPAGPEHLALVAVKNHRNGARNPKAHLRFEVTIQQVMASPVVADPFRLLDCCPQSDGAAAVVLAAGSAVDRLSRRPVWIRGFGLGLDRVMHAQKADLTSFAATRKAAKAAYDMARLRPEDIHVAELHDCFSGVELIDYEDLGFCEKGGAASMVERGETEIDGRLPVNPSGGLKAKGHPPGATGVAQACEIYWQLREEAALQAGEPRVGLWHNVGGPTAVAAVTIASLDPPGWE